MGNEKLTGTLLKLVNAVYREAKSQGDGLGLAEGSGNLNLRPKSILDSLQPLNINASHSIVFAGCGSGPEAIVAAFAYPMMSTVIGIDPGYENIKRGRRILAAIDKRFKLPRADVKFTQRNLRTLKTSDIRSLMPRGAVIHVHSICTADPPLYVRLCRFRFELQARSLAMWQRMWNGPPDGDPFEHVVYSQFSTKTHLCVSGGQRTHYKAL